MPLTSVTGAEDPPAVPNATFYEEGLIQVAGPVDPSRPSGGPPWPPPPPAAPCGPAPALGAPPPRPSPPSAGTARIWQIDEIGHLAAKVDRLLLDSRS